MLVVDSGGDMALTRRIMLSSNGKYLVSTGDDKVVRIWDVATGKTVWTIRGQRGLLAN
jgi:WD40 repeat protein